MDNVFEARLGGEVADLTRLREAYDIDGYVDAVLTAREDQGISKRQIISGLPIAEPEIFPRVYRVIDRVLGRLALRMRYEVHIGCLRELIDVAEDADSAGAFLRFSVSPREIAVYDDDELAFLFGRGLVRLTSSAIEGLSDGELASVIGHEFGHLVFRHCRWNLLERPDNEAGSIETVLPLMGDLFYREWKQKREISADRMGAIAAGNFRDAATGLVKVCFGLSSANFDVGEIDSLVAQLEELKGRVEIEDDENTTHPVYPIRLKALQLFCDAYFSEDFCDRKLTEVDRKVDALYDLISRRTRNDVESAALKLYATAGLDMISNRKEPSNREIREMCDTIARFTSWPLLEFVFDVTRRRRDIARHVRRLNAEAPEALKMRVVSLLIMLSAADGAMSSQEHAYILKLAARIGIGPEMVGERITHVMTDLGFPVDFLLEDCVTKVRNLIGNE